MDTANETINALLEQAKEYRQAAEEKPAFRDTMLWVAARREEEADALFAQFMSGKPGA